MLKNLFNKIKNRLFINREKLVPFLSAVQDINIELNEAEYFKNKYDGFTDADYEAEVEELTEKYVADIERDLLDDATFYHVDYDGTSLNDDLFQTTIDEVRESSKELASAIIEGHKLAIKKIPVLKIKRECLLDSCKKRTGMSRKKFERKVEQGKLSI